MPILTFDQIDKYFVWIWGSLTILTAIIVGVSVQKGYHHITKFLRKS